MSKRWRRIGFWALLIASVLAVAAVVGSSMHSEHYFRSEEARRAFVPDPKDVATAFLVSAGEGVVLCLILCAGTGKRLWPRFLIALVVFVPWLFAAWQPVGPHVPGYVMINALWVALIVMFLTAGLVTLLAIHIWRRIGPQTGEASVV